jgi:hypothetical protein
MNEWAVREATDLVAELRRQRKLTPEQETELQVLIEKGHADLALDILTAIM